MSRELEIRTTILAKKSGRTKAERKDANDNDVYADEALQLLQEIQELKNNMQKTDERILNTYKKSPTSKPKRKSSATESTGRRVAYDVIYPSVGSDHHRDMLVSHCLNPSSTKISPGAGSLYVPAPTTFTSAPANNSSLRQKAAPSSSSLEERIYQQRRQEAATAERRRMMTSSAGESNVNIEKLILIDNTAAGSSSSRTFKRVYAQSSCSPDSTGEIMRGDDDLSSHEAEEVRPPPSAREGENIRHARTTSPTLLPEANPTHTQLEEPESRPVAEEEQQLTGVEMEESLQATPRAADPEAERASAAAVDHQEERKDGERVRQERVKHYDREEIRKYMQKQKKDRKTTKESPSSAPPKIYERHLTRSGPTRRAELGLPSKPSVITKRKQPQILSDPSATQTLRQEENWGPYDSPNFVDAFTSEIQQQEIAKTPPPPLKRKDRTIGANQESKSIQTEAGSYRVDEATQVSSSSTRRRNDDSSDEWLHILPSARVESNSSPPPLPLTISNSSGLSSLRPQEQQPQKPKPVTNLLRQIEVLEHYIGNILEAPSLHLHQETVQPLPPRIQLQQPPPPPPPQQRNQTVKMPIRPPQHYSTPMQTAVTDGGSGRRLASHPQGSSSLDSSASTEYIPLPDQLTEFVHRSSKRSRTKVNSTNSNAAFLPSGMNHGSTDVKSLFRTTERSTATTTAATKYYDGEEPGAAAGLSSFFQLPPPKSSKPPAQPEEPQQTYFRDFNEILQMDPNNPMTERSNSWKRVSRSRATEQPKPTLPSAPYNILSAITDELRKAQEDINRMPKRSTANITSDTDFQSRLSISDASSADAAPPPQQQQPSKNGSGSRIAPADGDSRTKNKLPTPKPIEEPRNPPELMETTYLTLTPQYTSLDTTTQSLAGVHPPNSSVLEEIDEQKQQDASSIFSARLSPIPRAVSPLSLVSNDSSLMERKQSTSSSERSEHDRSMGDPVVEESARRITKTPSPVAQATIQAVPSSGVIGRTPEDLITRLRSELLRDESLMRSLHHVERLEDAAGNGKMQDQQKRFRIQFDPQTRSFFESQTEALRAIAHDVRSGLASHLQGSKQVTSSSESDKIQNEGQEQPDVESKQGTYTPDFSAEEVPSESWATTEKSTASDPKSNPASGSNGHGKAHHQHASDSDSTLTALSDTSVLPPKAVDLLLQEEAKQQRLLLKLREKAQVEKTLAELELLQMQKRILRAQGEREKAASIKKKQRGLLLKLQEERARIESLRRQHKKDEQRSKGSFGESNNNPYDSTFWETDWSASSAASAAPSGGVAGAESSISSIREKVDGDGDESSSTTLYAPSEVIQASADEKEVEEAEDEPISQPKSELEEGNESASAASNTSNNNLRLRAPLSPRTGDNIRVRMKFRHRHSSGSDDSINLSQTETASDVSDVESRLLALTDQLTRRQAEAQRLKGEHKRISKEKLKAQESALIKQIEVYDRCITDLRTQLDRDPDVEAGGSSSAVLAVRPVIRQPRALTRADDAKSPTSSIRNESGGAELLDTTRSLEGSMLEGPPSASQSPRKVDATGSSSTSSSIATDIRTEDDLSAAADQLTDGGVEKENAAEISDSARTSDPFNQTMIIKSDSQVKEELAEEISRSILNSLVDETVDLATDLAIKNRAASKAASSSNVMQRVSALLSAGSDAQKGDRSQLYLTTTFDLSSPDEARSPAALASATAGSSASTLPSDVTSTEGRSALESKLNELQIENEWIDDDLETVPIHSDVESEENRLKVLQEAEALEKEQKRIEQEIQRLSSGSVLYLQREIPNKPPPPYTPPGQALSWPQQQLQLKIRPTSAPEIHRVVPKSKDEVSRYCRRFANFVLDSALNSTDPAFPEELYAVDFPVKDQPAEYQTNRRAFMMLLGDLSRTFVLELIQRATFLPNWRAGGEGGSSRPIRTREELVDAVENSVLVQFNYRPRLRREGQLAKWSQKKRDRVDEILVKELQTEEKLWTDFSKEEAEVKRQTADAILDLLLEETVQVYKRILQASKRAS